MKSRTNTTRLHIHLMAIGILAAVTGPVLAEPAPDLANTIQAMRQETTGANANQNRALSNPSGPRETKRELATKEISVPASQGISSVTVFVRSGERTEAEQFDVAPLK